MDQHAPHPFNVQRMGRCARLAWDHAVEAYRKAAASERPRPALTTGDLLLGVLQEPDCAGGLLLRQMGLDLALAHATTRFVLFYGRRAGEALPPASSVEDTPVTEETRTALQYSWDEAELYSPTYPIGTEHLILAVLRVPHSTGARLLNHFGIHVHQFRAKRDQMWDLLKLTE